MTFFKRCEKCHKNKFYVAKREYKIAKLSIYPVTSNSELCRKCYKEIKKIVE